MSADTIATAQLAKARHSVRCDRAQAKVNEDLEQLSLAVKDGRADVVPELRARLIASFTAQLDLLIAGPAVDAAIKEAQVD